MLKNMFAANLNNRPRPKGEGRWLIFMLLVAVALIFLILNSCVTDRAYKRILSECPVRDSSATSKTIVKERYDSLIYITEAGPVLFLENPCASLCDSFGNIKVFAITKKTNGIKSTLKSDGKILMTECNVDSLKLIIEGLNTVITVSKEAFEERIKTITICDETWWQVAYRWSAWFLYLSLAITILFLIGHKLLSFE